MQIKTLITDQTFILKKLSATPRIHNQISTSAVACALTPPAGIYSRTAGWHRAAASYLGWQGAHPPAPGALSFTQRISKFLLGHLREGKYLGHYAGGTMKQCLRIGCPALQIGPMKIYRSAPPHSITLWSQAKLCCTKPKCANFMIDLADPQQQHCYFLRRASHRRK